MAATFRPTSWCLQFTRGFHYGLVDASPLGKSRMGQSRRMSWKHGRGSASSPPAAVMAWRMEWFAQSPTHIDEKTSYSGRTPSRYFATEGREAEPAVGMMEFEGAGRGWFATRDLAPGELIMDEKPIASYDIEDLATAVMYSKKLSHGLHVPLSYPMREPPVQEGPGLDSYNPRLWSKSVAQVISNGFRSPDGCIILLADASLFNHSCQPNAAIGNPSGASVQVRALREVKEGQEIAICYDSSIYWLPTERRTKVLKQRWGFECGCARCSNNVSNEVEAKVTRQKATATEQHVQHAVAGLDRADALLVYALDTQGGNDAGALRDAAGAARRGLEDAEGAFEVTHWRVRRALAGFAKCLWLLDSLQGGDKGASLDYDLGYSPGALRAELRRVLRVGMAAEREVVPPLHPMRLELFGLWDGLGGDGEEWKLGGALDDLVQLRDLWESSP